MLLFLSSPEFPGKSFSLVANEDDTVAKMRAELLHVLYAMGLGDVPFRVVKDGEVLKDVYTLKHYKIEKERDSPWRLQFFTEPRPALIAPAIAEEDGDRPATSRWRKMADGKLDTQALEKTAKGYGAGLTDALGVKLVSSKGAVKKNQRHTNFHEPFEMKDPGRAAEVMKRNPHLRLLPDGESEPPDFETVGEVNMWEHGIEHARVSGLRVAECLRIEVKWFERRVKWLQWLYAIDCCQLVLGAFLLLTSFWYTGGWCVGQSAVLIFFHPYYSIIGGYMPDMTRSDKFFMSCAFWILSTLNNVWVWAVMFTTINELRNGEVYCSAVFENDCEGGLRASASALGIICILGLLESWVTYKLSRNFFKCSGDLIEGALIGDIDVTELMSLGLDPRPIENRFLLTLENNQDGEVIHLRAVGKPNEQHPKKFEIVSTIDVQDVQLVNNDGKEPAAETTLQKGSPVLDGGTKDQIAYGEERPFYVGKINKRKNLQYVEITGSLQQETRNPSPDQMRTVALRLAGMITSPNEVIQERIQEKAAEVAYALCKLAVKPDPVVRSYAAEGLCSFVLENEETKEWDPDGKRREAFIEFEAFGCVMVLMHTEAATSKEAEGLIKTSTADQAVILLECLLGDPRIQSELFEDIGALAEIAECIESEYFNEFSMELLSDMFEKLIKQTEHRKKTPSHGGIAKIITALMETKSPRSYPSAAKRITQALRIANMLYPEVVNQTTRRTLCRSAIEMEPPRDVDLMAVRAHLLFQIAVSGDAASEYLFSFGTDLMDVLADFVYTEVEMLVVLSVRLINEMIKSAHGVTQRHQSEIQRLLNEAIPILNDPQEVELAKACLTKLYS